MSPLTKAWYLVTHLGLRWVFFRVRYAVRRRSGTLRRLAPTLGWDQVSCPAEDRCDCFQHRPSEIGKECLKEAEDILQGKFRLFSCHEVAAAFPPAWTRNQLTGETAPAGRHWSTLGDFAFGDIKGVWELSRFPWAFALARAYARTSDERFAEGFWRLFEDWLRHNPPNSGPNWMCGQEATFRLIAVTFARQILMQSPASTLGRSAAFRRFVTATGRRIEANLDYALSQSNNHGISECVGLLVAASVLPAAPEAARWWDKGIQSLRAQLADLVYADGGFSQHSAVYHRVLLHDLMIARCAMKVAGKEIPAWFWDAGRSAAKFLGTLIAPETGEVPLYGPNDGANILPVSDADFLDFRPVWQAAAAVFLGYRSLPPGPWDELAEWIGADDVHATRSLASQPGSKIYHAESGCLVWRSGESRLFLRCPVKFRHRPAQCDLLHVDIAWKGLRIAQDAGTYSYNTSGSFKDSFKTAAVHNTVTFDDHEPMQKVGRFLYLPWPQGEADWSDESTFAASHDGWEARGVGHIRVITSPVVGQFVVDDRLQSRVGSRRARVHWLLSDVPHDFSPMERRLILRTPAGDFAVTWSQGAATLMRADPLSEKGWWSPRYYQAEPALSLTVELVVAQSTCIETIFTPV